VFVQSEQVADRERVFLPLGTLRDLDGHRRRAYRMRERSGPFGPMTGRLAERA
jgi:hypothetical protein